MAKDRLPLLYFDGLGANRPRTTRSRLILAPLVRQRYTLFRAKSDFTSGQSFEGQLGYDTDYAKELLSYKDKGRLAIVSTGDGISLAKNVFGRIPEKDQKDVWLFNLKGFTAEGLFNDSQSLRDSVEYCETVTIPNLTPTQQEHIVDITTPPGLRVLAARLLLVQTVNQAMKSG